MIILKIKNKPNEFFTDVESLIEKYPIDIKSTPEDFGFGKCSCGCPMIESVDKKYLHCYEESYCKNNSKPILR